MKWNQFIDEYSSPESLVTELSSAVELLDKGAVYKACCPFHGEKTPSFTVYKNQSHYHCFGCGKSGNVFTFLQEYHGVSFAEAVETLARKNGVTLEKDHQFTPSNPHEKGKNYYIRIHELAHSYYKEQLKKESKINKNLQSFLKERDISPQQMELFELGYAPPQGGLALFLKNNKVPLEEAAKLGLVKKSQHKEQEYFDVFRDRILFSIWDAMGNSIAFGGRVLVTEDASKKGYNPKYLNSPETPLFSKKKTLYHLPQLRKQLSSTEEIIVVEGYMDVFRFATMGMENSVAILGTAFTPEQAKKLKFLNKKILFITDEDDAGLKSKNKALDILLPMEIYPQTVSLSPFKDPDEFLSNQGKEAFLKLKRTDLFVFFLNLWSQSINTDEAQDLHNFLEKVAPYFSHLKKHTLFSFYRDRLKDLLCAEKEWLYPSLENAIQKYNRKQEKKTSSQQKSPVQSLAQPPIQPTNNSYPQNPSFSQEPIPIKLPLPSTTERRILYLIVFQETLLGHFLEAFLGKKKNLQSLGEEEEKKLKNIFPSKSAQMLSQEILILYRQNPSLFDRIVGRLGPRYEWFLHCLGEEFEIINKMNFESQLELLNSSLEQLKQQKKNIGIKQQIKDLGSNQNNKKEILNKILADFRKQKK